MPLRIAIVGAIAIVVGMGVPISVNAVSSTSQDSVTESLEDPEPPEPHSSQPPVNAIRATGIAGVNMINAAGYGTQMPWTLLVMIIVAGLVPSVIMISRSTARRRAGPET